MELYYFTAFAKKTSRTGPSATYASQAGKYGLWTSVCCVYTYKYGRNTDMNMGVWAFTRTYICVYTPYVFTGELCSPTRFSLAETLALAGTTGAGRMAPPTRTRISAKLKRVQGHSSSGKVVPTEPSQEHNNTSWSTTL